MNHLQAMLLDAATKLEEVADRIEDSSTDTFRLMAKAVCHFRDGKRGLASAYLGAASMIASMDWKQDVSPVR